MFRSLSLPTLFLLLLLPMLLLLSFQGEARFRDDSGRPFDKLYFASTHKLLANLLVCRCLLRPGHRAQIRFHII